MTLISPKTPADFEKYYALRWRILRAPWGEPKGSEQDAQEESSYHIMAMQNQEIIGVARLQFPEPDFAQLRYMAVEKEYEGQGIGKKIVLHMEDHARQNNANILFLNARENAVGFYERLGYTVTEKSYLLFDTIQHYKMQKSL